MEFTVCWQIPRPRVYLLCSNLCAGFLFRKGKAFFQHPSLSPKPKFSSLMVFALSSLDRERRYLNSEIRYDTKGISAK